MTLKKLLKNTVQDKNRNMEEPTTKTRSGRVVKKPNRYIPTEKVEDDYSTDDYDTEDDDDTDVPSIISSDDDESEGSLADFIVDDDSESDSDTETSNKK